MKKKRSESMKQPEEQEQKHDANPRVGSGMNGKEKEREVTSALPHAARFRRVDTISVASSVSTSTRNKAIGFSSAGFLNRFSW
eukprot:2553906-Rhodomonas_salina.4